MSRTTTPHNETIATNVNTIAAAKTHHSFILQANCFLCMSLASRTGELAALSSSLHVLCHHHLPAWQKQQMKRPKPRFIPLCCAHQRCVITCTLVEVYSARVELKVPLPALPLMPCYSPPPPVCHSTRSKNDIDQRISIIFLAEEEAYS